MKKKNPELKKLHLSKATLSLLNPEQRKAVLGGATIVNCGSQGCNTYDPQQGCETHPRPGRVCL